MATYTSNYNLKKPDTSDYVSIGDLNDNADLIDLALSEVLLLDDDTAATLWDDSPPDDPSILDALLLLHGYVQCATGSYTGTGTYGVDNPTVITFPFVPKLVLVSSATLGIQLFGTPSTSLSPTPFLNSMIWYHGQTRARISYHYDNYSDIYISQEDNSLSMYSTSSTAEIAQGSQLNTSGSTYYYIAFG